MPVSKELLRLFPTDESIFLGFMLVVVGVSQLVCPIDAHLPWLAVVPNHLVNKELSHVLGRARR